MSPGRRSTGPRRGPAYAVGAGLSVGLLALVVGLAGALVVVPMISRSVPLTVLTSSMEPTLPPGTLLVVAPVQAEDIRVGDVITYQLESGNPEVVTHRVVAVTSGSDGTTTFTTQGDNNDAPDANPVIAEQVRGRVWYSVPWIGHVNAAINGELRAWGVPALSGALFVYAGYMVASQLAESRRRRKARPASSSSSWAPVADGGRSTVRPDDPRSSPPLG